MEDVTIGFCGLLFAGLVGIWVVDILCCIVRKTTYFLISVYCNFIFNLFFGIELKHY